MTVASIIPLIVTKDSESAIELFEALGFDRHPAREGNRRNNVADVQMKDASGFQVDVTQDNGKWTVVRMHVDDPDEAIALLEACGFHRIGHSAANKAIDTGASRINVMVSPSRFILAVSPHAVDHD